MSTDSTTSDENMPDHEDRQGMIGYYVDELIQEIVENPCASTPQLFRSIAHSGPCETPEQVLHLFGGGGIFRRTCNRLQLIRDAALRGTLDAVAGEMRRWMEPEQLGLEPQIRGYESWWVPHLYDRTLFWYEGLLSMQPGMYRCVVRYPTHTDTDDFFRRPEEDAYPSDSEETEENWIQPLNMMEMDWQYEEEMDVNMEHPDVQME